MDDEIFIPRNSETPENPENPEDVPKAKEDLDRPEDPIEPPPEAPEEPPISDDPALPEAPEPPREDLPKEPEAPEGPREPEAPEGPREPEAPEGPREPEAPEGPREPEAPGGPREPEAPEGPREPEAPEGPREPEAPDQTPEVPEAPESPRETPRVPRETSEGTHSQSLNIIRNHDGDFEFTSTTTAIETWKTWNNDLWAKLAYMICEQSECAVFHKLQVGEGNPAANDSRFRDFKDGDDHFVMSETKKLPEDELHRLLNESDAFERGNLWIVLTRENAPINPSNIFTEVFLKLQRGDGTIDGSLDVECVGRLENGNKLVWHHITPEKWGTVESRVLELTKALRMNLFINGYKKE